MAIDPDYAAIYELIGVDATLDVNLTGGLVDVRVIDKTKGEAVNPQAPLELQTMMPACAIRVPDLTAVGIVPGDLRHGTITFSGHAWRIESWRQDASSKGPDEGEVYAFLIEAP